MFKKILHAIVPALGAAAGAIGDAIVNGGSSAKTVAMAASGAFVAYMFKKARPAEPPKS